MRTLLGLMVSIGLWGQGREFDLVVYGATAGGVATAVAGARQGLKTVLLEPGLHVGGMATGGLSRTDVGKREVIGGLALEFYYRVGERYELRRFNQPVAWFYEPRVGEEAMREMLEEAGVTVLHRQRLKERGGVRKQGLRVTAIEMGSGLVVQGKVFADCTYEGDLMAQAGISYTWGRESVAQYGESLAGVRDKTPKHQFLVDIPARGPDGKVYAEISEEPRGADGAADKRIQAYNFRVIATDNPANRIAWPKPEGYDAKRYELVALLLEGMTKKLGRPPVFHEMTLIANIPNRKADFNNNGAFSTDYIGKNYDYPEGSYERRAAIWKDHENYVKGYYYFLANDPRVPATLREEVRQWGLPKDEYPHTGHWPHQLYVREARRMIGEFVVTQKDLQTERTKPDVIGMGSYNSDSHNVQRFVNERGMVENEGDMQVPVEPYQIPLRVLLPKAGESENVMVPVCFSASHVAYSSLRMEPQYMILGHAAGLLAAMAVQGGVPVQRVEVGALQAMLRKQGAVFAYAPNQQMEALGLVRNALRPKGPARSNLE
jgi:hypothetical protein